MEEKPWRMLPPENPAERPRLTRARVMPVVFPLTPIRRQDDYGVGKARTSTTDRRTAVKRPSAPRAMTPTAGVVGPNRSQLAMLRVAAGYTLPMVGAALGVEPSTVGRWENGRPPRLTSGYLDAMARLYQVDREQILAACRVRWSNA